MNRTFWIILATFSLAGCAQPYYRQVCNEQPVANARHFAATPGPVYNAAIQAMLERNFILEKEDKENGFLLGKRTLQDGRRTASILLQAKIIASGSDASIVYLNAVQTTEISYVADRTRFFLFLIPLPGGGGKQCSSVKEGEKTIRDPKFYESIFVSIEKAAAAEAAFAAARAAAAPAVKLVPATAEPAQETVPANATGK
jgi:hypothetical protein